MTCQGPFVVHLEAAEVGIVAFEVGKTLSDRSRFQIRTGGEVASDPLQAPMSFGLKPEPVAACATSGAPTPARISPRRLIVSANPVRNTRAGCLSGAHRAVNGKASVPGSDRPTTQQSAA